MKRKTSNRTPRLHHNWSRWSAWLSFEKISDFLRHRHMTSPCLHIVVILHAVSIISWLLYSPCSIFCSALCAYIVCVALTLFLTTTIVVHGYSHTWVRGENGRDAWLWYGNKLFFHSSCYIRVNEKIPKTRKRYCSRHANLKIILRTRSKRVTYFPDWVYERCHYFNFYCNPFTFSDSEYHSQANCCFKPILTFWRYFFYVFWRQFHDDGMIII